MIMIFWLIFALIIEANLIMWCHFGIPKEENDKLTPTSLIGEEGEVINILNEIYLKNEKVNIKVYSKSRKNYKDGELIKIIEESDGLYFIK